MPIFLDFKWKWDADFELSKLVSFVSWGRSTVGQDETKRVNNETPRNKRETPTMSYPLEKVNYHQQGNHFSPKNGQKLTWKQPIWTHFYLKTQNVDQFQFFQFFNFNFFQLNQWINSIPLRVNKNYDYILILYQYSSIK